MTNAELEKIQIEITKLAAETRKLVAEAGKLSAESGKLNAEAGKMTRETFWYPVAISSGMHDWCGNRHHYAGHQIA